MISKGRRQEDSKKHGQHNCRNNSARGKHTEGRKPRKSWDVCKHKRGRKESNIKQTGGLNIKKTKDQLTTGKKQKNIHNREGKSEGKGTHAWKRGPREAWMAVERESTKIRVLGLKNRKREKKEGARGKGQLRKR